MKKPLEKAWEDLKEATEKWNKEALKAMGETKEECRCEKDGFLGAVWRGDCPIHKDETPTENHYFEVNHDELPWGKQKENWREEFDLLYGNSHGWSPSNEGTVLEEQIKDFIESLLLTQRKEILSMIEGMKKKVHERDWDQANLDEGYNNALSDLSLRIEERYKHNN